MHAQTGAPLTVGPAEKMSKSKRNVVDPDAIIEQYGADTARWFMLSDTPPERDIEWTEAGVAGAWRFTQRLWRLIHDVAGLPADGAGGPGSPAASTALRRVVHQSLHAVSQDIEGLRFNRAIARIHELANALADAAAAAGCDPGRRRHLARRRPHPGPGLRTHDASSGGILLAGPGLPGAGRRDAVAPGRSGTAGRKHVTIAVQVNGKRRDEVTIPRGLPSSEVEQIVLKRDNVLRALEGRSVKKIIVVPDRIANVVVSVAATEDAAR